MLATYNKNKKKTRKKPIPLEWYEYISLVAAKYALSKHERHLFISRPIKWEYFSFSFCFGLNSTLCCTYQLPCHNSLHIPSRDSALFCRPQRRCCTKFSCLCLLVNNGTSVSMLQAADKCSGVFACVQRTVV